MSESQCRCPLRPYFTSWGSGSAQESAALNAWDREHGAHTYAKTRDALAVALQAAEGAVGSGAAVLDMVADVFSMPRSAQPSKVVAESSPSV